MTADTGFAPNPFHGWCTLGLCTPNHQNAQLKRGDIIAGFFAQQEGYGLVYAMRVDEILCFDEYYRDRRFAAKKPQSSGGWASICGDNIYYLERGTRWAQHPRARYHTKPWEQEKDTRHPVVFIGKDFCYFGERASEHELPKGLSPMINARHRGIKYTREWWPTQADMYEQFISWWRGKPRGRHGWPRNRETRAACSGGSSEGDRGCGV